jgi:hypothetical protein
MTLSRATTLGLCVVLSSCWRFSPQTYFPAPHNWAFRDRYPSADHLFNAFDYGHAILSEVLLTRRGDSIERLERREYDRLTRTILPNPPSVPLDASSIAPRFTSLAPEIEVMFEWAHMLHRQAYDVWADDRLSIPQKDAAIARLLRYYQSRSDLAFSAAPKSMHLMDGQPFSGRFRANHPRFNGLIWAYHWLQVGIYDALMASVTAVERERYVAATVKRFYDMVNPESPALPTVMPMTAAVAPRFAARYPELAIIFDNLHSMHDVVSDILVAESGVPSATRRALLRAASQYRDSTTGVTSRAEWVSMSRAMGIAGMGGLAIPMR